jgi:hypothetical protein
MQRHDIYNILGIAFFYLGRYGGDLMEKFCSRFIDTTGRSGVTVCQALPVGHALLVGQPLQVG